MLQTAHGAQRLQLTLLHLTAAGMALLYAWLISRTIYVRSGVQFVAPLAIVLLVHLAWLAVCNELQPGFAAVVLRRTLATSVLILVVTIASAIYTPMPVAAAPGGDLVNILWFVGCLGVLALVIAVAAAIIYVIGVALNSIYKALKGPPQGPGESRLLDAGVAALALLAVGAASLEGIAPAFTFAIRDGASSTLGVTASPTRVWQEVGKATSPSFPLPAMLRTIPQPVAVLVDEGASLGARRVVRFKGREGEGNLVLKVVRQTDDEVIFEAISDDSPIAKWVRHRSLTFRVVRDGAGSRLTVASQYDRLLSPAWFFRPYVRFASYLAVDVLARDTKQRAEARVSHAR
jgi:hypothetical protein